MASQPAFAFDYDDGAEVPASSIDGRVLTSAEHGNVVYLTDERRRRVAAVVPLDVTTAGQGALRALEEAEDAALAEQARSIQAAESDDEGTPLAEVLNEIGYTAP